MKKINIRHWHSTHNDWLRALKFYQEELDILNKRLTEIAGKNKHMEVSQKVAHFQNQFLIQEENIENLVRDIHSSLHEISEEAATYTGFIDENLMQQLEMQKQTFLEEEKAINELRHAFNLFCAE
jgi:hypothetical protein